MKTKKEIKKNIVKFLLIDCERQCPICKKDNKYCNYCRFVPIEKKQENKK